MKLLYTDIRHPLTKVLVTEAESLVAAGKRVFILRLIRYLLRRSGRFGVPEEQGFLCHYGDALCPDGSIFCPMMFGKGRVWDIGLGMLIYRTLTELDDGELKVYGRIKKDAQFIQQLMDLYHELQTAQMSFADLEFLEEPEKRRIWSRFLQR